MPLRGAVLERAAIEGFFAFFLVSVSFTFLFIALSDFFRFASSRSPLVPPLVDSLHLRDPEASREFVLVDMKVQSGQQDV